MSRYAFNSALTALAAIDPGAPAEPQVIVKPQEGFSFAIVQVVADGTSTEDVELQAVARYELDPTVVSDPARSGEDRNFSPWSPTMRILAGSADTGQEIEIPAGTDDGFIVMLPLDGGFAEIGLMFENNGASATDGFSAAVIGVASDASDATIESLRAAISATPPPAGSLEFGTPVISPESSDVIAVTLPVEIDGTPVDANDVLVFLTILDGGNVADSSDFLLQGDDSTSMSPFSGSTNLAQFVGNTSPGQGIVMEVSDENGGSSQSVTVRAMFLSSGSGGYTRIGSPLEFTVTFD